MGFKKLWMLIKSRIESGFTFDAQTSVASLESPALANPLSTDVKFVCNLSGNTAPIVTQLDRNKQASNKGLPRRRRAVPTVVLHFNDLPIQYTAILVDVSIFVLTVTPFLKINLLSAN